MTVAELVIAVPTVNNFGDTRDGGVAGPLGGVIVLISPVRPSSPARARSLSVSSSGLSIPAGPRYASSGRAVRMAVVRRRRRGSC